MICKIAVMKALAASLLVCVMLSKSSKETNAKAGVIKSNDLMTRDSRPKAVSNTRFSYLDAECQLKWCDVVLSQRCDEAYLHCQSSEFKRGIGRYKNAIFFHPLRFS